MFSSSQCRRFDGIYWYVKLGFVVAIGALACCHERPEGHARAGELPAENSQASKIWKVLMIGNSYTYFNNLPKMFEEVALADKPARQVKCEMIVEGGATLQKHWKAGKAVKAIERGDWDFVILQEQSTLGETYLVQGQPRIGDASQYFASARRFHEAIQKSGGRTVLFAFWARENAPKEDHDTLAYYHYQLGQELGAIVAPVGLAWQAARKQRAQPSLYHDDHSHPRPEGSYLTACALYAACFGAVPPELPLKITGKLIDVDGQASAQKEQTLVEVSPQFARTLRDAANESLTSARQFARELERHKPVPPRLPQLERGSRPTIEELQGDWTGETKMYPRASERPATMTFQLAHSAGSWQAKAKITFGGKPPDIVLQIGDFQITDEGISFVDQNKEANGGGVARYRGAYTDQSLKGIGEITLKEARLYLIGSWELRKK